MNIDDKIRSLGSFFKGLNVVNNGATFFVLVKFPDTWKVFDEEGLKTRYGVFIGKKEEGLYFMTDAENGFDNIFDAIQEVVNDNRSLEEKAELFKTKTEELRDLFVSEPLEKLKTLEFTFAVKKSARKPKNAVKNENASVQVEEPVVVESPVAEEPKEIEEKGVSKKGTSKKNNKTNDSDTMSFMKGLTGEDKKK